MLKCSISVYKGFPFDLRYRFQLTENGNDVGFIIAGLSEEIVRERRVKVLYIEDSYIHESFRGKGYGKLLYAYLAEAWHSDPRLNGAVFERLFINRIAYRIARWLVDSGKLPESTWDEDLITCAFE